MSRRPLWLVLLALAACATGDLEPADRTDSVAGGVRVRIVTGNITSGNKQAYEDPGIRIFRGLHPDVALVQELNYKTNSAADLRSFVDQAFGADYVYYRESDGAQIPNGIVSRYPIVAAGEWRDPQVSNRDFVWARIDVPGPVDLYAVSVHLLTANSTVRQLEAQELVNQLHAFPADAYLVIGGDLNTTTRAEPCLVTLGQLFQTSAPYPLDLNGNGNTNASRAKPYDWVLVSPNLAPRETAVVLGGSSFASGFVADTRVYTPIADLSPALTTDSAALNMQHMAVVRDFVLPTDTVTPAITVTAPNGGERLTGGATASITWTATAVDAVKIELSLDGATWTTLADGVAVPGGAFAWTVPDVATSAASVRVSASPAGTPADVSDATFTIVPAPRPARVFLNEILANEPGSNTAGEFVEIVNSGDLPADLSGWTISDALQVRYVFPAATTLAGHTAIVITGSLSLNNGGDTVTLADAGGRLVDREVYPAALSSVDGVSMNRQPDGDPAGTWVLHTTLSSAPSSPGARANGSPF